MPDSKSKLETSATATEAVSELTRQAAHILREGYDGRIMVNGYGIFSDHTKRRDELQDARDAINKALALIDAAEWPGKADYEDA